VNAIIFSAGDGVDPSIIQENDLNNTSIFRKKKGEEKSHHQYILDFEAQIRILPRVICTVYVEMATY
jgi:1,4-dihydroxy-2-naphthoyl-CoA synthase